MQLSDFTPNTQFLSGSLFSFRVLELLRCEHFGEDGLRDTAGIYFRDDIFPLTVGKPVCCQTLHSVIRTGLWRKLWTLVSLQEHFLKL